MTEIVFTHAYDAAKLSEQLLEAGRRIELHTARMIEEMAAEAALRGENGVLVTRFQDCIVIEESPDVPYGMIYHKENWGNALDQKTEQPKERTDTNADGA